MAKRSPSVITCVVACLCASGSAVADQRSAAASPPVLDADNVVLVLPTTQVNQALASGCWVTFYGKREFKGESVTLLGPVELSGFDKSAGRQFKRELDSLAVGPKANLTVFEHQMFKDRYVQFGPGSKEGGLIHRLGFGGRVQSLKLNCTE